MPRANQYCKIHLDSARQPSPVCKTNVWGRKRPFIFTHDNAPPHHAKKPKIYTKLRGIGLLPWPAHSSDLSIIENVWLFIKNKFSHDPMTLDVLQQLEKNLLPEYLKNGDVYLRVLSPNLTTQFLVVSMRFRRYVVTRQYFKIL